MPSTDRPPHRRYLAEAIGTFALVFAGTGAVVVDAASGGAVTHVGVALTFGLVVMAVIYAIGEVSGAHINPAVTLGFWAAGRFPARHVLPYVGAQAAGALGASLLIRFLFPEAPGLGGTYPAGSTAQAFAMEVALTFLLMFVILCVAVGAKEVGLMAGTAIGGTVALEALFAGPVSGASMNPARSLAPALVALDLSQQGVYVAAPVAGALVAVVAYRAVYGDHGTRLFGASPTSSRPNPGGSFTMLHPVRIDTARDEDLPSVLALLSENNLPEADLARHVETLLVARKEDRVVGSAALELYEDGALLRSVAVAADVRGEGLGHALTEAALQLAEAYGVTRLFLLTTTAERFFPRFGFEETDRGAVPPGVRHSPEFTSACPASAHVLVKRLSPSVTS